MDKIDKDLNLSLIKAFTLLDFFNEEKQEWGVRELAKKIGYNKTTTYRLLNTLEYLNVLHQNENQKYSLGIRLFELGSKVSMYKSLIDHSKISLENIAKEITETVLLGTFKNNKVLYLNKVESAKGLKVSTQVGSSQPVYCTAIGKVLLSFLPDAIVESYLTKLELVPYTKNTIINMKALRDELKTIQKKGYALDMEELELGLICVAIPIFNGKGEIIAGVSASGPSTRFKKENINKYVSILVKGVNQLEAKMKNNI